ncbi:MAG: carboxypeptidase-like regulatory domain-containing protein [Tannerella sp.]|jgi:hypothetical protein|nr:carboxypeptidase-like regulatory domain-containing protein [Tannerella sp.]
MQFIIRQKRIFPLLLGLALLCLSSLERVSATETTGSLISGIVSRASDGGPIAGAIVILKEDGRIVQTRMTGYTGQYTFVVGKGSYTVEATSGGYQTACSAPVQIPAAGNYMESLNLQLKAQNGSNTATEAPDRPVRPFRAVGSLGCALLSGLQPGMPVFIYNMHGEIAYETSACDENLQAQPLPPGIYIVAYMDMNRKILVR